MVGANRSKAKPVTPANKAMSARHLRESRQFNLDHAREHQAAAQKDSKDLAKLQKKQNKNTLKRAKKT